MKKPLSHSFSNQRGFSLVEVLIASGIGTVAALFIGKTIVDLANAQNTLNSRIAFSGVVQQLQAYAQNPSTCTQLLPPNQALSSTTNMRLSRIPAANYGSGNAIVAVGSQFQGVTMDSLELADVQLVAGSTDTYTAKLKLQASINRINAIGGNQMHAEIPLLMSASGGVFSGCSASAQQLCESIGGVMNGSQCVPNPSLACTSLGGSWDSAAGRCALAPTAQAQNDPSITCTQLGGLWAANHCNFNNTPSGGAAVAGAADNKFYCPPPNMPTIDRWGKPSCQLGREGGGRGR